MHTRNVHKNGYDFAALTKCYPALSKFVVRAPSGRQSIDFGKASAVKALNAALLRLYYNIEYWDIPEGFLCPAVPGRADYIHALADLLRDTFQVASPNEQAKHQSKESVVGLDVGTGANLIYPIIGSQAYAWKFIASDCNPIAIKSARLIQQSNKALNKLIELRQQKDSAKIFEDLIKPSDKLTFTMCNPPFHKSEQEAKFSAENKNTKLARSKLKRASKHVNPSVKDTRSSQTKQSTSNLNFAGQHNELWCDGGEVGFIKRMIMESKHYRDQVHWFTSLVSKKDSIKSLNKALKEIEATETKVIKMDQGNKSSRFIAWRF